MENTNQKAYRLAVIHYIKLWLSQWRNTIPSTIFPSIGMIFVFYIPPLLIARIIQTYHEHGLHNNDITLYVVLFGIMWFTGEALWRLGIFFDIRAAMNALKVLSDRSFSAMLEKDMTFFQDNFAGSLTKRTTGYINRYIDFSDVILFNLGPGVIPLIFACAVLWSYSWMLVAVLLGMMVITGSCAFPFMKRRAKLVAAREKAYNIVSGHIADVYSNIDATRAFGREKYELQKHNSLSASLIRKIRASWSYHNSHVDMIIAPLYALTNVLGLIVALHVINQRHLGIETLLVVFAYFGSSTRLMWEFNSIYRRLETAFSGAAQFTELLLEAPGISDHKQPALFTQKQGEIIFDNVTFHYNENDDQALFKDFQLHIKPGEKIGLVGRSGGGKTTLTKLLLRFMDIDAGEITIDGQNIADVRQADLRSAIAYVPQEPFMFHRSISDNIRYGKLDASDKEIQYVADASHSADFIQKLSAGFDTLIGERGVKLSGGQRQRIAIARAMIKDAPILLLDEATSALDSESEGLIQDALQKLMEHKTTIVIAHRLSTIQKMDRILVLDDGKIVEQGTHAQLLNQSGTYAELWSHQSGGFLED